MNITRETKAILILILVTVIWGLTFILIQHAVDIVNPVVFVLLRVLLASIGFLPFVYARLRKTHSQLLWGGMLLAFFSAASYIFQSEGLKTIPASRSAFITGTCVVIVPLLAPLFRLARPKKNELLAATVCLVGLYILTGANLAQLSTGAVWTVCGAVAYAITIIILQIISKHTTENMLLSFYMTVFSILPPAMLLPFVDRVPQFTWQVVLNWPVSIALVFCALAATTLVTYLMVTYQKHTTVTKAAVVYTLEPVFATLFAWFIGGQQLTKYLLIGGSLILIGILLPMVGTNIKRDNKVQ